MTISWLADKIEQWPTAKLVPYARNSRTHSDSQVAQIAANGIGRHLQLCNQFANAQLTGFAKPVENMFLPGELMHGH